MTGQVKRRTLKARQLLQVQERETHCQFWAGALSHMRHTRVLVSVTWLNTVAFIWFRAAHLLLCGRQIQRLTMCVRCRLICSHIEAYRVLEDSEVIGSVSLSITMQLHSGLTNSDREWLIPGGAPLDIDTAQLEHARWVG